MITAKYYPLKIHQKHLNCVIYELEPVQNESNVSKVSHFELFFNIYCPNAW